MRTIPQVRAQEGALGHQVWGGKERRVASPWVTLCAAVLDRALKDLSDESPLVRRGAVEFFVAGRHEPFAEVADLDVETIKEWLNDFFRS